MTQSIEQIVGIVLTCSSNNELTLDLIFYVTPELNENNIRLINDMTKLDALQTLSYPNIFILYQG